MDGLLATSLIDHAAVNAAIAHPTAPAGKAKTMDVDSATLSFNPGTAVDPNMVTKANAADAKAPCQCGEEAVGVVLPLPAEAAADAAKKLSESSCPFLLRSPTMRRRSCRS